MRVRSSVLKRFILTIMLERSSSVKCFSTVLDGFGS